MKKNVFNTRTSAALKWIGSDITGMKVPGMNGKHLMIWLKNKLREITNQVRHYRQLRLNKKKIMYQAKEPRVVFDPYEYLPPYGETNINLNFYDNSLELNIFYENEDTNKEACLKLSFINAFFFKSESYPGVVGMSIEYDYGDNISSLIKFSNSNYANKWEENFNNLFKLNHYKINFLNVNKSVEVICEDFKVDKL